MPLAHILGLDHVVVTVRDLDAAAEAWRRLGFTVSPRGTHSAHLGSANYTIMFGEDYIELLGVLTATEHLRPTIAFLAEREGLERAAFTTDDAAAGAAELRARGIDAVGPVHFGRPVELPGGGAGEARFNVFRWPPGEAPGGLRVFACQHLTRETVWIPELQWHRNGATKLVQVEVLADDPAAAADHLSRLIDEPVVAGPDGFRVPSGNGRADFLFSDTAAFADRYPAAARVGTPTGGAAALVVAAPAAATADIPGAIADGAGGVFVPAAAATGVLLHLAA